MEDEAVTELLARLARLLCGCRNVPDTCFNPVLYSILWTTKPAFQTVIRLSKQKPK